MHKKYLFLLFISFRLYAMNDKNEVLQKQLAFSSCIQQFDRLDDIICGNRKNGSNLIHLQIQQLQQMEHILAEENVLQTVENLSLYNANFLGIIANQIIDEKTNTDPMHFHNPINETNKQILKEQFSSIRNVILESTQEPNRFRFAENYALTSLSIKIYLMLDILHKTDIPNSILNSLGTFFTNFSYLQRTLNAKLSKKAKKSHS